MPVIRKTVKKSVKGSTTGATKTRASAATSKTAPTPTKPKASTRKPVAASRTRTPVKPTTPRQAKAAATRAKVAPTKPTAAKKVKEVAKPTGTPRTGPNRVVDETTGFAVGTDSHTIAMELLKGGESRAQIIERCAAKLPKKSNRGTDKPVSNMVASVLGKMRDAGFTVTSSFGLEPPTRASKAAATKRRNARLAQQ